MLLCLHYIFAQAEEQHLICFLYRPLDYRFDSFLNDLSVCTGGLYHTQLRKAICITAAAIGKFHLSFTVALPRVPDLS